MLLRGDMRYPGHEMPRELRSDVRSDMDRHERRETRPKGRDQAREKSHGATPHEQRISHSALEALAIEVERIGEAQRFLTQALLERTRVDDAGRRVDASRAVTPH